MDALPINQEDVHRHDDDDADDKDADNDDSDDYDSKRENIIQGQNLNRQQTLDELLINWLHGNSLELKMFMQDNDDNDDDDDGEADDDISFHNFDCM